MLKVANTVSYNKSFPYVPISLPKPNKASLLRLKNQFATKYPVTQKVPKVCNEETDFINDKESLSGIVENSVDNTRRLLQSKQIKHDKTIPRIINPNDKVLLDISTVINDVSLVHITPKKHKRLEDDNVDISLDSNDLISNKCETGDVNKTESCSFTLNNHEVTQDKSRSRTPAKKKKKYSQNSVVNNISEDKEKLLDLSLVTGQSNISHDVPKRKQKKSTHNLSIDNLLENKEKQIDTLENGLKDTNGVHIVHKKKKCSDVLYSEGNQNQQETQISRKNVCKNVLTGKAKKHNHTLKEKSDMTVDDKSKNHTVIKNMKKYSLVGSSSLSSTKDGSDVLISGKEDQTKKKFKKCSFDNSANVSNSKEKSVTNAPASHSNNLGISGGNDENKHLNLMVVMQQDKNSSSQTSFDKNCDNYCDDTSKKKKRYNQSSISNIVHSSTKRMSLESPRLVDTPDQLPTKKKYTLGSSAHVLPHTERKRTVSTSAMKGTCSEMLLKKVKKNSHGLSTNTLGSKEKLNSTVGEEEKDRQVTLIKKSKKNCSNSSNMLHGHKETMSLSLEKDLVSALAKENSNENSFDANIDEKTICSDFLAVPNTLEKQAVSVTDVPDVGHPLTDPPTTIEGSTISNLDPLQNEVGQHDIAKVSVVVVPNQSESCSNTIKNNPVDQDKVRKPWKCETSSYTKDICPCGDEQHNKDIIGEDKCNITHLVCCNCDQWFHTECVNLTKSQASTMIIHKIPFTCIFCLARQLKHIKSVRDEVINIFDSPVVDQIQSNKENISEKVITGTISEDVYINHHHKAETTDDIPAVNNEMTDTSEEVPESKTDDHNSILDKLISNLSSSTDIKPIFMKDCGLKKAPNKEHYIWDEFY